MPLTRIKQIIKKIPYLLAAKHKEGVHFIILLKSGRNLMFDTILGGYSRIHHSIKADKNDLKATIHKAQMAYKQGQYRLALLLAHQCDCVSEHPTNPELKVLLEDLSQRTQTSLH